MSNSLNWKGNGYMRIVYGANLALRFALELCMLAALAYWGFRTGDGVLIELLLGIGAPLLAAIVWGTFLSPKASVRLANPLKLALEIVVFGAAITALYAAGQHSLAWVFAVVVLLNRTLLFVSHN